MNSILEVRVRARTSELQKLNLTLEQKVDERTSDLEEKIKDLEKFQRITVGRELKMIELKKEIEPMRAKIAQLEAK
jgi:C4-dicarboxylate-specific signal transduction histidine kinase